MKVLVIDDVPMNVLLVRASINSFCEGGFLSASRGTEGIEIAVKEQPQLIFLDLGLPDIDGLEVARILSTNSQTSHIPIIALTARANEESRHDAINAGCTLFMGKPLDVMQLRKLVSDFRDTGRLASGNLSGEIAPGAAG